MHNAALIVNNADNLGNFWSSRNGDYLFYFHPFGALDYANSVLISRGENCIPTGVSIWGLLEDVELGGQRETKSILLSSQRIGAWPRDRSVWFPLSGQYASFRGYALRFENGASSSGCVHVSGVRFQTRSELHCRWEGAEIEVGDALRVGCGAGEHGVTVLECVRSENGTAWGDPKRFCEALRAPTNRGVVWVTVSVSGLHLESEEHAEKAVLEALESELDVDESAMEVYFEYTRHGTGLFLYKEFYIRVEVPAMRGSRVFRQLTEHSGLVVAQITTKLNHEVVVKLKDLECVVDRRLMVALMVALPVVAGVLVVVAAWVLWRKRRQEIQERMLLLA